MTKIKLTVVIPVYNEKANIPILYKKLKDTLQKLNRKYEIIFVDDGSTDKSYEELKKLHNGNNKFIKIIKFRKNFGQSAAIYAGFLNSKGDLIVVMDSDLQNDPSDIPKLLNKLYEGYDVVSGWRYKRKDPMSKILTSKISNWMHRKLTGLKIHDSGCTLKVYKKEVVKDLNLYGEMHRYIPALVVSKGFKIAEVKVNHNYRKHGKSKYGGGRIVKGFLDLIYIHFLMKYAFRPLHFFGFLGLIPIVIGFMIGLYKTIQLFILTIIQKQVLFVGPLLLFAVFLILIGILFIIFGFLAEMNVRMFYSETDKKNYEIETILYSGSK